MLNALLETAGGWPVPLVVGIAAVLLVVESGTLVGMVLPGTTLLVALGLWSHAAPGALVPATAAAATATVAGAHLGWWRGCPSRMPAAVVTRAERAGRWLAGRGPLATAGLLMAGHWAAAARPIGPRVAGTAGTPYRIIGPAVTISGAAWATTLVLLGHHVGPQVLDHAGWAPVVLAAALLGVLLVRSRRTAGSQEGDIPALRWQERHLPAS